MKINPSQIAKAMEIYKSRKPSGTPSGKNKGQQMDELVLSDQAQAFQVALKAVQQNDGVNMDRVRELKAKIGAGEYNVNSRDIAKKMVEDILSKKRI